MRQRKCTLRKDAEEGVGDDGVHRAKYKSVWVLPSWERMNAGQHRPEWVAWCSRPGPEGWGGDFDGRGWENPPYWSYNHRRLHFPDHVTGSRHCVRNRGDPWYYCRGQKHSDCPFAEINNDVIHIRENTKLSEICHFTMYGSKKISESLNTLVKMMRATTAGKRISELRSGMGRGWPRYVYPVIYTATAELAYGIGVRMWNTALLARTIKGAACMKGSESKCKYIKIKSEKKEHVEMMPLLLQDGNPE